MYVEAKRRFKKSKKEILNEIRRAGNLNDYHPFCKENNTLKWPGKGSIDEIEYLNGLKYRRDFIEWDENGYVLEIGRNKKIAKVQWIVEGSKENSSLRVRINPRLPYKNQIVRWVAWNFYIKFRLQNYINNVLKGFEHFINTKHRVERNKFGKHAWFS